MKKVDISGNLSKKNTIIAIVAVVAFVIVAIVGMVVGHKVFIDTREAEIVGVSTSFAEEKLFFRADGLSVVYCYGSDVEVVSLREILTLSEGATFTVGAILDESGTRLNYGSSSLDVSEGQRYFVILNVTSYGGAHANGYVLEIVSASEYSEQTPEFDFTTLFIKGE